MDLEGAQSKLVMRRDKDDHRHRLRAERLQDPKAIQFRHLDIKKNKVGRLLLYGLHRLASIRTLADQLDLGLVSQQLVQTPPRQRFVIDDQGSHLHFSSAFSRKGNLSSTRSPPSGPFTNWNP